MAYRCKNCGHFSLKWMGKCPDCEQWNSFEEVTEAEEKGANQDFTWIESDIKPLADIELDRTRRWRTRIGEFDRILGGGIIPGALILIGGEPGVGKSTLMLQVAGKLSSSNQKESNRPVVYISGEELPGQIKLRANRLGVGDQYDLLVLSEQSLLRVEKKLKDLKPQAIIVDSIQSIIPSLSKTGGPGSIQQVGEATYELNKLAKRQEAAIFLIGHITKGGELAGPKTIEHMVDVVMYLEGGNESDIRILRAVKNRYGATDEIGVFQMKENGLNEVINPSKFFTGRDNGSKSGSSIVPSLEGTRPILVEIQALVTSSGYGNSQRRCTGLDYNRVLLLLAVIEKNLGLHIGSEDIYLNLAGGISIKETALDLGITSAVVSSFKNRPLASRTIIVGEVSLNGEVRRVKKLKTRLNEAAKLGYERAVIPMVDDGYKLDLPMEIVSVRNIKEAMDVLEL